MDLRDFVLVAIGIAGGYFLGPILSMANKIGDALRSARRYLGRE
jgi:hypothetical protein